MNKLLANIVGITVHFICYIGAIVSLLGAVAVSLFYSPWLGVPIAFLFPILIGVTFTFVPWWMERTGI